MSRRAAHRRRIAASADADRGARRRTTRFAVRRAKLDALREAGEQPYVDHWDVTARAAELEAALRGVSSRRRRDRGRRQRRGAPRRQARPGQDRLPRHPRRDRRSAALHPLNLSATRRSRRSRTSTSATGWARRHRAADPARRALRGAYRGHAAVQVAASASREVPRALRHRDPLPAALRRPDRQSRGTRRRSRRASRSSRPIRRYMESRGLPRGRDADAAADPRRRDGSAVRDPPQRAGHGRSTCASPPSSTSSGCSWAASNASTRSIARSATRACRITPQPRVHHARGVSGLRRHGRR